MFDRSHYEDVLVVRVHNLVPPEVWGARYDEINEFERKESSSPARPSSRSRCSSRSTSRSSAWPNVSDRPDKYWKYNPGDIDERALWPKYQEAYQAVLDKTSTAHAPWYVLPANKKWYARLAATELLISALEELHLDWPPADFDVEAEKRRLAQA